MSRLIGLAIIGLAVYLAVNSLPDFSSRDSHMTAVAIATDNREGIAADLKNMTEPARSFSAANPLLAQPKIAAKIVAAPATKPARKVVLKPFWTVTTGSAKIKRDATPSNSGEKVTARNVELAALDNNDDVQPVLIKAAALAPPKYENVLLETQRELKRVGCYKFRIDGIWGKGSRWALRRFVIKAKTIPIARKENFRGVPNSVLLEYLRKTSQKVCGKPCGSGRMLSAKGRCINDPVITASLVPSHSWSAEVKVDKTPEVQTAAVPSATIIQTERVEPKKAKRRAAKKWRKKRYALGGPKFRKYGRTKSRRYTRSARKWRKYRRNAWKRRILSPEY